MNRRIALACSLALTVIVSLAALAAATNAGWLGRNATRNPAKARPERDELANEPGIPKVIEYLVIEPSSADQETATPQTADAENADLPRRGPMPAPTALLPVSNQGNRGVPVQPRNIRTGGSNPVQATTPQSARAADSLTPTLTPRSAVQRVPTRTPTTARAPSTVTSRPVNSPTSTPWPRVSATTTRTPSRATPSVSRTPSSTSTPEHPEEEEDD
jgi:hypothetical protein